MKFFGVVLLTIAAVYADEALQEFQKGNIEFSASLYKQLIKKNHGNMILSPLSIQLILALTQLGAKGKTALELSEGLHLPNSQDKIKDIFKALLPKIKGNELYTLNSANKLYLKEGYTINPEFSKVSKEIFDAAIENIDFLKKDLAAETINKWVEGKTNNKIKDLISPKMLDELTRLVLVNAVYFKGNWSIPFEDPYTFKGKFFKSEKDIIDVDTMHQTHYFKYAENKELDAKFLEIPYEGNDVVFTVMLPNKKEGLGALEGRLTEVLRPQKYSNEEVSLFLPKFKIESSFDLVPALKELGIKEAFSKESDLSGLLTSPERLAISDVVHKAFINVTESGTEAAAATAVIVQQVYSATYPIVPPKEFRVDHPFLYSIGVKKAGIVFFGRVNNPPA